MDAQPTSTLSEMLKPESHVEAALEELCVNLGYCLPPSEQEALLSDPPANIEAFVDAVLLAEGLDPDSVAKPQRGQMIEIVSKFL